MKFLNYIKKNTIILLIITMIILYIVMKDDFKDIVLALKNIDFKYILVAMIFFFASIVIKGYVNYLIVNDKKKITIKEAIKHNTITQFFNGVTPFSTGGQPMEIYMLTEHGISIPDATNKTVQSFIFYQIALVICGLFAVIYNSIFHIFPKVKLLEHLVLLGFLINIAVIVVLLLISYSKRATIVIKKIVLKFIKRFKLKITEEAVDNKLDEYYNGFQDLHKRKRNFVSGILLNIASLLCLYSVPLFILYSMHDYSSLNAINTVTASAYVYVIGAFVPIPGASGGIEYGFTQFFGNFIKLSKISAVLLLWRFITYYFGVIVGALIFTFEKKVKK